MNVTEIHLLSLAQATTNHSGIGNRANSLYPSILEAPLASRRRKIKSTSSSKKTERSAVAVLMHWMRNIISEERLNLGPPDVETIGTDRKMPDLIIYQSRKSKNPLAIIEAKTPDYDAYSDIDLKGPAREKAVQRRAAYFITTNFQTMVWWSTTKCVGLAPEDEQILNIYELSTIQSLAELEAPRVAEQIKAVLRSFLRALDGVTHGGQSEPRIPVDTFLVRRLQEKIRLIASYVTNGISERFTRDSNFAAELRNWFGDQGWTFNESPGNFERAARQSAYLLINKLFFYNLLRAQRDEELDRIAISPEISKPVLLQKTLQAYFDQVLEIDYESIYKSEFLDTLVFCGNEESVQEIGELIDSLNRYDFAQQLGYDVIGQIFEQLIPSYESRVLGQHFTNSLVVDLILQYCVRNETDVVLDPSCGAGTFLVRAYTLKKFFNALLEHEELLETLWGCEISKFPAHLATINLAKADLGSDRNYPHIIHRDFFEVQPHSDESASVRSLNSRKKAVVVPEFFDAIVGNPPYTRQEDISKIAPENADYKRLLIESALTYNDHQIASFSSRAGLHAYFFVHCWKFLRENGRFGFVVVDTWLDASYGVGLQHFLLQHFKIIAIIGSECERWFDDADTNTCIVLLEKCSENQQRADHLVRFATLKLKLEVVARGKAKDQTQDDARWQSLMSLLKSILGHNDDYEAKHFRVRAVPQSTLLADGTNDGYYKGSKWSKYLKAPRVFLNILKKPTFVKLKDLAKVKRGFTTGADPWFYVEEVQGREEDLRTTAKQRKVALADITMIRSGDGSLWPVEKRFLAPVIQNPMPLHKVWIDLSAISDRVVLIRGPKEELEGTLVLDYIRYGEKKPYVMGKGLRMVPAKTKTCLARELWYALPDQSPARIFFQKSTYDSHRHYISKEPVYANQRFYGIIPHNNDQTELIASALNSSLTAVWLEVQRAALGLGALEATVEEVKEILIPNPNEMDGKVRRSISVALRNIGKRDIGTTSEEFGSAGMGMHLPNDRVRLESLVLGTVGQLADSELKDLWRSASLLALLRKSKAASVKDASATSDTQGLRKVAKAIFAELGTKTIPDILKQAANLGMITHKLRLPQVRSVEGLMIRKQLKSMGWEVTWGSRSKRDKRSVQCQTQAEAQIVEVALRCGVNDLELSDNEAALANAAERIVKLVAAAEKAISSYATEQYGPRERQRLEQKVLALLWGKRRR